MSTYIVLTSKCYENARANGICGKKIQEALIKRGYRAILVGYTPNKLESELEVKEDCYKFHYAGGKHKSTKIDSIKRIFVAGKFVIMKQWARLLSSIGNLL